MSWRIVKWVIDDQYPRGLHTYNCAPAINQQITDALRRDLSYSVHQFQVRIFHKCAAVRQTVFSRRPSSGSGLQNAKMYLRKAKLFCFASVHHNHHCSLCQWLWDGWVQFCCINFPMAARKLWHMPEHQWELIRNTEIETEGLLLLKNSGNAVYASVCIVYWPQTVTCDFSSKKGVPVLLQR